MSKSQFVDFKTLKASLTMEQVLGHYGLLDKFKRTTDSFNGPCPIHKGSNPTQFRVSISKNIWNCFSECKHGGNVLDFIARMENVTIHAAALKAMEWFNLDSDAMAAESAQEPLDEKPAPKPVSRKPEPEEKIVPNKPLKFRLDKLERNHPYLTQRGLSEQTIIDFGIGYCAKGMMAERIAIPIHNPQGEVVAYAGRFPGTPDEATPKYKLPQGFRKSLELFNSDRAFQEWPDKPLLIVEGFFGCMNLWQQGYKRVVALMGSSMSSAQEDIIRKHSDRHSQIFVMLDEDEAGRAGREDIAVRLSRFAYVKVHTFGEEGQQPENLTAEDVATL